MTKLVIWTQQFFVTCYQIFELEASKSVVIYNIETKLLKWTVKSEDIIREQNQHEELNGDQTWSGWATSENMTSTMPTSILYFAGCLASSIIGMTLVRFLAMFTKSLPLLWENSTA